LESFLPIALKYMTPEQWKESTKPKFCGDIRYKPKFYCNIRYKPKGEYVPPVEVLEAAAYPEPAPSTVAPAASYMSSEEEEEEEALQLIISEEEKAGLKGVAAAIARSTTADLEVAIAKTTIVDKPPPTSSRSRGGGRGVRRVEAPPSAGRFGRGILSEEAHQSVVGRGRAPSRGREPRDYVD
jgi:hypothetical protein